MCEANAYLMKNDQQQLIMEAVDTIEPEGEGLRLVSIFGEQKFLKARVQKLSLVEHKVYLEPLMGQA